MKIKTIEVARKFNLGNYETQDIKLIAEIDEADNPESVITELKNQIKQQAGK